MFVLRIRLAGGWIGLLLVIGLAGCVTPDASVPPAMDFSTPDWTIREGQAVWKPKPDGAGIAGELLVAMNQDGRSVIQFSKTPLPLVMAELGSNHWRITFA